MRKYLLILLIPTSISMSCTKPDLYDKISTKMCECLEEGGKVDSTVGQKCYEEILSEFADELVEYYKLKSIRELNIEEFDGVMIGRMAKNCKYLMKVFEDTAVKYNPQFVPDAKPICKSVHTGKFYTLEYNLQTKTNDTTYVTFTNNEYLEKMQRNNSYGKLSIEWESDCHFKLTFIESSDPYKKGLSKPGDVYEYEIRKVTEDSFFAEYISDGPKLFIEYKRVK